MKSAKSVIIRSSTWEEEAPVDFEIKEVGVERNQSYPLTLTNPENGDKEVYPIENTMMVSLMGESDEDVVNIAFSESLVHDFEGELNYNDDGNIVLILSQIKRFLS